jgi:hypothetical protein
MKTDKISITVPADLLDEARSYAPDGNLSAYIAEGLRRHVLSDRLARYLSELDEESGPLTPQELEAARREWRNEG